MKAYFDHISEVNLSHIAQIKSVRPQDRLISKLLPIKSVISSNYSEPGVWPIEVSTHTHQWANALDHVPNSINIIDHIPSHVITGVKEKKLRILILSTIEGDSFINEIADSFRSLTDSIHQLALPKYSIIIIAGNLNCNQEYIDWCQTNNEIPWIEFVQGLEWGVNWNTLNTPIFNKDAGYLFNSLNRSHRPHRTDHLYMLAKNNLLSTGMVSGGTFFNREQYHNIFPTHINCHKDVYQLLLRENYPRIVDIEDMEIASLGNSLNFNIFLNSLLTISTETFFSENGLLITEKSLRPLAVGHPLMVLGQPGVLAKLQNWGFVVDFLDIEYDNIIDPFQRFDVFHQTLISWICSTKQDYFNKWQEMVTHNQKIYQDLKSKIDHINQVINSTEQYFLDKYQYDRE